VHLANALVENHHVLLITRDHNYEISSDDQAVNLDAFLDECLDKRIIREKLRYRRGNLKNFFELGRVFRTIRAFDPDIIHIQENSDWRIFWLAKAFGFDKTVLTIHDVAAHPGDRRKRRLRMLPSSLIYELARIKARRIIVHGDYLKKQLISISKKFENRVSVVPHGILSIFKNWDDEIVNEEKNTILFFGRISRYKGIDILIKAQPLISKEIPKAKIIIAGKGREKDFAVYESLMEDKSSFEIHYEFIPHAEVQRFFRRASVVVLPYVEASQSGVVAVAYVFGKPVVVTHVGSIPEVVDHGKTGFIVPPRDPEALAKALVEILKNQDLRETMGKNALAKAETELSWTAIAKKTTEIYELIQSQA
jgi:glycosyltransferase involved in cell wall biosynthesis